MGGGDESYAQSINMLCCAQNNQHNVSNNMYNNTNDSINVLMIIMKKFFQYLYD